MKKLLFAQIFIWLCSFAQGQAIYDLRHCLEIGLQQNFNIRIMRNEETISSNNATVGNAGYLPTIDLNAGYSGSLTDEEQRTTEGITTKTNGVNDQTLNAGINLNWTVFDGLNIQSDYKRLKEMERKGKLNTRLSIENFIASLSAEYYNYVRQNIRLKNLTYAVELSRERLRIVRARYEIGSMSRLDLQQAKVDFNADSSNLIKQYELLHVSRTALNKMMALENIETPLQITDSVIDFDDTLNKEILWKKTLESNTDLLLAERNKSLSELDLKISQSRNYPYLKVFAGYGYTKNLYNTGTYDRQQALGFNYGATLGFNIFDGTNRMRAQRNAKIEVKNRNLQYQQIELALKADLSNIWMAYQNNMELTNLEEENLENAKENYEIAIDRYKLGSLSGIELREAQNSLLESEERLLVARYNTKLCELSLLQLSGQIAEYLVGVEN
jgi:outer membrane protein TolC